MSSLMEYNGIQLVTPDPSGFGGLAFNNNFKALSTAVQAADPTAGDDSTAGFSTGSRWYNYQSTEEWICTDPTQGDAVWQIVSRTQSIATVATTAALPSNTYNNGASGVGAKLTGAATGTLTVDGHVVALNDLVLVKNESSSANNGLYLCTTAGAVGVAYVLTRAATMNSGGTFPGAMVTVGTGGTVNANTIWVANPSGPVTVGTTAIPFVQMGGWGSLTAGTGISISAGTISVVNGVYTTGSYSNPAWITSISGSIVSGNISGNAANVTGVVAAANGGTGVANTNTITLGGNLATAGALTTAGAYGITVTATGTTSVTLPTGGTLLSSTAATMASALNMGTNAISNVVNPTNPQDAATKNYVDATVQGLQVKSTATVATTAALPSNTYSNGSSGVGATLTATATGTLTVDGHTVALNDLVLVKNESSPGNNGLYSCTTAGATGIAYVLSRTSDMDIAADFPGAFVPVGNVGTANANSLWLANPSGTVTVGTTAIPFTQLNAATQLTAGANINISGNTISATPAGSNTQIQFNNSGSFGASANLTFDGTDFQVGADQLFFDGVNQLLGVQAGSTPFAAVHAISGITVSAPVPSGDSVTEAAPLTVGVASASASESAGSGGYTENGSNYLYYIYNYYFDGTTTWYSPAFSTGSFTDANTAPVAATGVVSIAGVPIADGASVTIGDGSTTVTFTFWNSGDAGWDPSYVDTSSDNAFDITDVLVAAINSSGLNITAVAAGGSSNADLTNNATGTAGNVMITKSGDTGGDLSVGGMSGGANAPQFQSLISWTATSTGGHYSGTVIGLTLNSNPVVWYDAGNVGESGSFTDTGSLSWTNPGSVVNYYTQSPDFVANGTTYQYTVWSNTTFFGNQNYVSGDSPSYTDDNSGNPFSLQLNNANDFQVTFQETSPDSSFYKIIAANGDFNQFTNSTADSSTLTPNVDSYLPPAGQWERNCSDGNPVIVIKDDQTSDAQPMAQWMDGNNNILGQLYVDSSGNLWYKGMSGTVTQIATA